MTPIEAYGIYLLIGLVGAAALWMRRWFQIVDVGSALFVALCVTMWPLLVLIYVREAKK